MFTVKSATPQNASMFQNGLDINWHNNARHINAVVFVRRSNDSTDGDVDDWRTRPGSVINTVYTRSMSLTTPRHLFHT